MQQTQSKKRKRKK